MVHNAFQHNTLTCGTCFYFKCLIGIEPRWDHSKPGQSPSTEPRSSPKGWVPEMQTDPEHIPKPGKLTSEESFNGNSFCQSFSVAWPTQVQFPIPTWELKIFCNPCQFQRLKLPLLASMSICTHVVHRYTCLQINHTCKININNFLIK